MYEFVNWFVDKKNMILLITLLFLQDFPFFTFKIWVLLYVFNSYLRLHSGSINKWNNESQT
jgi:hypothetical protein